jgi:beta-lactamase superfamily II metal-dependent hydrolase
MRIVFWVFDVGQGTGNYIELYKNDDDEAPIHTILIDIGSESQGEAAADPSADQVIEQLKKMRQPTIDSLFISHADSDHRNRFARILDEFDPYDPMIIEPNGLLIRRAAYGGPYAEYGYDDTENLIADITRYMTGNNDGDSNQPDALSAKVTSFPVGGEPFAFDDVGPVQIYIVAGNVAGQGSQPKKHRAVKRDAIAKNTDSLVFLLKGNGSGFVATGDATGKTMLECNKVIVGDVGRDHFGNTFMVTAPHHGSRGTSFNLSGGLEKARGNVERFGRRVDAATLTVSAWQHNRYKHPSYEVLACFAPRLAVYPYYVAPGYDNVHFLTAYYAPRLLQRRVKGDDYESWPKRGGYWTLFTGSNMYSTSYYPATVEPGDFTVNRNGEEPLKLVTGPGLPNEKPATGLTWQFSVDSQQRRTLVPFTNRELLSPALLERLAAGPAPRITAPRITVPAPRPGLRRARVFA